MQLWVIAVIAVVAILTTAVCLYKFISIYKKRGKKVSPLETTQRHAPVGAVSASPFPSQDVMIEMPMILCPHPVHSSTEYKCTSALVSLSNLSPSTNSELSIRIVDDVLHDPPSIDAIDSPSSDSDQEATLNEEQDIPHLPSDCINMDIARSDKSNMQGTNKILDDTILALNDLIVQRMEMKEDEDDEELDLGTVQLPVCDNVHSRSTSNTSTVYEHVSPPNSPVLLSSPDCHLLEESGLDLISTTRDVVSSCKRETHMEMGSKDSSQLFPHSSDSFIINMEGESDHFDIIPDFQDLEMGSSLPLHPSRTSSMNDESETSPPPLPRPRLLHMYSPLITSPLSPFSTPGYQVTPRYYQNMSPRDTLFGAVLIKMATQSLYASQRERTALFEQQHCKEASVSSPTSTSFCSTSLSCFVGQEPILECSHHDESLYFDSDSSDEDSDDGFDDVMDGAVLYSEW